MKYLIIVLAFLLLTSSDTFSQQYLYPLNYEYKYFIETALQADSHHIHTAVQPYFITDLKLKFNLDTLLNVGLNKNKFYKTWMGRKLRKEHLFEIDKDELKLFVDPLFNFQYGNESNNPQKLYVNSRGINIQGSYLDKFFFYTGFYENQAQYPKFINAFVVSESVVPGQGIVKFLSKGLDFNSAFGGIGYVLNRHFNFTLSQDKNFIGDGYRSLLLSDNTFNYPALKINMNFWKFNYTVIYAVMHDLKTPKDDNVGFNKKYATFHYVDFNIGKRERLSFGFFDAAIFKSNASRGYELGYLNPLVLLRPIENSLGSPDNVLIGANVKWKIYPGYTLYGQLFVDELILAEVKSGRGWWGNKQAGQLGVKIVEPLRIKNLFLQNEVNLVRPFMYGHRSTGQNYAHYNQPLAHPLGANFIENISIISYRYKGIYARVKVQLAQTASDTTGAVLGNNIYSSYDNRSFEYGNRLLQGLKNSLFTTEAVLNYIVNPKINLRVEAGIRMRSFSNTNADLTQNFIWFGLSTSLSNYYFDF